MSTIEKLGITGLRSYSAERIEVIEFLKPVTLILGKNGAGKTTIIEALRMAISGVMPPSSSNGRTFVNDPRLQNRTEQKAAVKLKFNALNGKPVLCIRSLQVNFTNKREEFRKLEQFIKIKHPNGETVTVGHTCAEIDKQIPELIGISRAVIENVVLCHQEESLWPFSDNLTLKKVFDDLFDTARIAKLSEQIRATLKEKKKQLRDEKSSLESSKREYERYGVLINEFSTHIDRISQVRSEIDEIKDVLQSDEGLSAFNDLQRDIGANQARLEQLSVKKQNLALSAKENGSWKVEKIIKAFSGYINFREKMREDLQRFKEEELGYNQVNEDDIYGFMNEEDNLTNEDVDKYDINQCPLQPPVKIASPLFNVDLSLDNLKCYRDELKKQIQDINKELEKVTEGLRQNNTKIIISEIQVLGERVLKRKFEPIELTNETFIDTQTNLLANLKSETNNQYDKVFNMVIDVDRIKNEEQTALQSQIKLLTAKLDEFKRKEQFHELETIREKLEAEKSKFEQEKNKRDIINLELGNTAKTLTYVREELAMTKKTIANRKFREYDWQRDRLHKKMALDPAIKLTAPNIAILVNQYETSQHLAEEKRIEARSHIQQDSMAKKRKEENLQIVQRRLEDARNRLRNYDIKFDDNAPYDYYKKVKDELINQKTQIELKKYSLEDFLPRILTKSIKSARCFVCDSNIYKQIPEELHKSLVSKIEKAKRELSNNQLDLQEKLDAFNLLHDHRTVLKELQTAITQKADLESEIAEISARACERYCDQKDAEEELRNFKEKLADLRELQSTTILLDTFELDDIDPNFVCEPERTAEVVKRFASEETDLAVKQAKESVLLKEIENKLISSKDKIAFFTEQIAKYTGANECTTNDNDELSLLTKEEVIRRLKNVNFALEDLPFKTEQNRSRLLTEKDDLRTKLSSIDSIESKFKDLSNALLNNPFPQKKKLLESELITLVNIDNALISLQKALEVSIEDIDLEVEKIELINKKGQLIEFERSLQDRRRQFEDLTREMNEREGQNVILQGILSECYVKIEKSHNVERDYVRKLSQAEYIRLLIEDMELVYRSLDNSLVQFHIQKITEINKIINNIWKTSYAGDDIETIKILSECTGVNDEISGVQKKNYEYKIVFLNKDMKQLAMKGRCSAGQRLFASIIIRLALSEAFCINSGLLALDEPTTNLDEENIRMLALFLKKLIQARGKQKSFQLIIITHDKEFVNMLSSNLDYYYYISKDHKGFSKIDKVAIEHAF